MILAKTIKGYGMGVSGEGQNITHQAEEDDRGGAAARSATASGCRSPTSRSATAASTSPPTTRRRWATCASAARRSAAGCRRAGAGAPTPLPVPELELFKAQLEGTGEREISTTMAFVRMLAALLRDKQIGRHIVPIVPDESRTFGMEGMFRQLGIYRQVGQLYQPEDAEQLMFYKEDKHGPDPRRRGSTRRARSRPGSPPARPTPTTACR